MSSWNSLKTNQNDGHAYNKTLLASLGFADSDRKNSLHDQACQFLVQPPVAVRLATRFLADLPETQFSKEATLQFICWWLREAGVEQALSKGEDQYKTTIGFIDVSLKFARIWDVTYEGKIKQQSGSWSSISVEVKIGKVSIAEVIRQINLYREHQTVSNYQEHKPVWLLATPWPITEAEKTALDQEKIKHVLLGDEFKIFVAQSDGSPEATSDAVF